MLQISLLLGPVIEKIKKVQITLKFELRISSNSNRFIMLHNFLLTYDWSVFFFILKDIYFYFVIIVIAFNGIFRND